MRVGGVSSVGAVPLVLAAKKSCRPLETFDGFLNSFGVAKRDRSAFGLRN
jgi:hypothetical protein